MFGTSGIRGPVGEAVTAELALSVGRALGAESDSVVVGRDPRDSGRLLLDALAAGLRESGTDVLDLGLAATPTVARAVGWEDADAGVAVTASHNPAPDNGLKLWQPSGQAYDAADRARIADRVETGDWSLVSWADLGTRTAVTVQDRHRRAIGNSIGDLEAPLTVVVDVGNGAGGVTAQALSDQRCGVRTLNAQPDGAFPGRPSEPTPEHCEDLATLVAGSDADLGIAHDGDADRMRAVTAEGDFLSGDVLLAVLAGDAASPGETVALPLDTSLAVEDHLADLEVGVERTPVGDVHVAAAASEPGVAFGGEPSGAWIWPAETLCPDGPLAACKLAALIAAEPLADRAARVETYPIRRESVETEDKASVVDAVREAAADIDGEVTTMDGVRVDLADAWFLVRASGTQPLVRLTAEARSANRADAALERARSLVLRAAKER
ncbi:MAG: phosphoglucosamine mutase [Haloarculaceae archaeon]